MRDYLHVFQSRVIHHQWILSPASRTTPRGGVLLGIATPAPTHDHDGPAGLAFPAYYALRDPAGRELQSEPCGHSTRLLQEHV